MLASALAIIAGFVLSAIVDVFVVFLVAVSRVIEAGLTVFKAGPAFNVLLISLILLC